MKDEMKTKLLLVGVILLSIGLGALVVTIPSMQREKELKKKLETTTVQNQGMQQEVQQLQEKVSSQLIEQKQTALSDTRDGLVFFTAQTTRLPGNDIQVDIYLKGDPKTTTDAIDLVLAYPQSVHIKEIRKGTAFVSYPRMVDQDNTVTITGIAMPQGNTFAYGKVNEIYATLIVTKQDNVAPSIELNTKDTQAYLNGTPVLDFTQSFKKIDL